MKKIMFIFSIVVILSISVASFSHPAKEIIVKFDAAKKNLDIIVTHDSKDINKHFIKEIRILFKDKEIAIKKFAKQLDIAKEEATFNLPKLKKGDKIIVVAKCNIRGIRSKEVTL